MKACDVSIRWIRAALAVIALFAVGARGECGESASLTRLYAEGRAAALSPEDAGSTLAAGARALQRRLDAAPDDQEARFGRGLLLFAHAIERFGQIQYRHGLHAPEGLPIPLLRLPVPDNPAPEPLAYETQRATLQRLVDDLAEAERALARVDGDVKVLIDLDAVQLNLSGGPTPDPRERLGRLLASLQRRPTFGAGPLDVAFDRADALWLRGYCNLLSALIEFALAYDWRASFETTGSLFYPRVEPRRLPPDSEAGGPTSISREMSPLADAVALVHTIRWDLVEPERLARAHARLKAVTSLSRQSWTAILAETDDDREWIPGPRQKNAAMAVQPVTQDVVDGWLAALDEFDAVLDGRKLIGHWRYDGGINLRKVFSEPRPFDLVFWLAGPGAAPYIERGEATSSETWARWERVFGGNFLFYAFWFN